MSIHKGKAQLCVGMTLPWQLSGEYEYKFIKVKKFVSGLRLR